MHSFNNVQIAFAWRSNAELRRALFLFKTISWPWLVRTGSFLLRIAQSIHFPISWIVKPTIFKQFVGGETLNECDQTIKNLAKYNVLSILDYSVEGKDNSQSHLMAYNEILNSINFAATDPHIAFTVFKPTGLVSIQVLEKISQSRTLTYDEQTQFEQFKSRVKTLCNAAFDANKPILIDAEDSWYQEAIDQVAQEMMHTFNKSQVIVYNTLQMYRTDRFAFLQSSYEHAIANGYKLGVKLVRGAYMEKERERAHILGYPSPIHRSKNETDNAFNQALEFAFSHIENISIFCGTHNEASVNLLCELMSRANFPNNDKRIAFSQLLGMSDNISFMLGHLGYNVAKYIPYGPVAEVMPYLIRRAQENTSVKGQTGRELQLIRIELFRRKQESKN